MFYLLHFFKGGQVQDKKYISYVKGKGVGTQRKGDEKKAERKENLKSKNKQSRKKEEVTEQGKQVAKLSA